MTQPIENQPNVAQLFAEIQQGVNEDSPASSNQNAEGNHEQSVPYERFQQVNAQKAEFQGKYTELLEQLAR